MDVEMELVETNGPFKPQKENVYNKLLPYADELEEESAKLFEDIKTNLIKSILAKEMRPGCALWTSRLMKYIKIYGMKFSKEDHIALVKLFYELVVIPDLEPTRINKCATTLGQLLKKKYLLTRDDLQLDWRPLYDLCVKVTEKSKTSIGMYRYAANFEMTLFHLIRICKVYFPVTATQEILDEFRPKLCIFNNTQMASTIRYLELFLPNCTKAEEADRGYKLWFEELMNLWDTCQDDSTWENNMMWIMTGLARYQIGRIDWQPYIPHMFVRFQRTFQLPVAFKQRHMGRSHRIEISAIAMWIVYVLNGDKNVAFFHFEKFIQSLESYFYPANSGRWSNKLRELLRSLSFYFIQRVHFERYKTPSWEFQVPDHFKLTDDDLDRFVNILKPCIEQALYNRTGLQDTSLTLQYLSCLRPNIIIPMTLEKLYSSVNSLTEPNKLTSSMMAVIACGRYMVQGTRNNYPEGPTHVIPLLMELLPGIDPNDIRKSYVTFNFIVHFVNMIPLIDSSGASNYYELSEEEHAVCEATANFEDFVLQFLDKLCVWMESNSLDFIRLEQMTNNENMKNRVETISESALGSVIGVVLNQCSPEIFKSALKKMYNFVTNKVMEVHVSGKMLAISCHCFAKVNPKETLKLFLPYLCDRIEELLNENPNIVNEEHIDDELLYNLLLLSELVDGRSVLLGYMGRLTKILDKTLHMTCQSASQLSARMLELIMLSLTNIQPTELKSCAADYSKPVQEFLPIREWGKAEQIKDLKISWYVPGKEEVELVQNLLGKYLLPELEKLENHSKGERVLTRQELKRSLKIIISLLSCQPLLPMWEEETYPLVESVLEPWTFNLKVSGSGTVTMPDGTNVRKTIVNAIHKLMQKILETDEGDTQSIQAIIVIYNIILFNKTRGQDFEFHWKSFHMTKKLLEDRLHQKKLHLRHVLIDRVMLQQEFRIESRNCSFTATHKMILLDLFELSTSRYSEVRMVAQNRLFCIVSYFPYSYAVLTDKIKEILRMDSEENHEKFKGCLYILLGPKSAPIIARHDWKFIEQLWPLLVKSKPSEKPSIINLIMALGDSIDKFFPTIAIKLVIPESVIECAVNFAKNVPAVDLKLYQRLTENGTAYLKRKSEERRVAYTATLDSLIEALESGTLHWRYHQMAINFLKDLVHFDVNYGPRIVKFFLGSAIDDSLTVRKTSMKILVYILVQNKIKYKKVECKVGVKTKDIKPGIREDNKHLVYNEENVPKNAKDWEELRYIHDQYTGYYAWPKKLEIYDSPSNQRTAAKRLDNLTEIERDIYQFFNNPDNIEKLIKFLSLEEKKGRDQFNVYRFYLFKNLFKIFEDKLLQRFVPHLERLLEDKLESSQRCAAEIISGIIRGSKHWEYDNVVKLWSILLPLLDKAISNISTETQTDWALCITMGLESRDPNRHHWLIEYLLRDPLKDPTIIVACTRLHLLFVAISQQSWRNTEISTRLLDYLKPHLAHPFKNIRERISALLAISFSNTGHQSCSGKGDDAERLSRFFGVVSPKMKDLLDMSLAKVENDKTDSHSEERESLIRLYKTVAKFVMTYMVRMNYSIRTEFLELIPLAALFQNNEIDEELATVSTNLLVVLSETGTSPGYIPEAIGVIRKVARCPSWSARAIIAEFLPIYIFYNMATINSRPEWVQEIQSIVLELLDDSQHEVRTQAGRVLSGLLHCQFIPQPQMLLAQFKQKARCKHKKKENSTGNNSTTAKHSAVLGLCAFIESHPYDVPDDLPDIFQHLRPHLSDPQPIPATIRKTLGDFKRTHHSNWETHKLKFTEEELCLLSDLTVPPSYYV